ncbi:hypothetical protein [Microbulbifer marinus]|uniref:Uncharacterized protein n=1 Tax=Microbulbifer marinus TaxID=658218 RepID=A0A1H3VUZ9_9GAMM|nr:hypothetical protein [Microbulbifer marinus]SDZ78653.1 hypothetical protein SAMN05216562_0298 [Microbulbifer marinus]
MRHKFIITGFDGGVNPEKETLSNQSGLSSILFQHFLPAFGDRVSWVPLESGPDKLIEAFEMLPKDKVAVAADINALNIEELDRRAESQRYLFIYSSPENVFFNAYKAADHDLTRANFALEAWLMASEKILKFFNENSDRCALVHISSPRAYVKDFTGILSSLAEEPVDVELDFPVVGNPAIEAQAAALVSDFSAYQKMYEKLQLSASLPGEDFFAGKSKLEKAQFLAKKAVEYIDSAEENNSRITELESDITSIRKENELALFQIHQLQEELERYYFKYEGIQSISAGSPAALSRSVDFARASTVSITGGYSEEGYKDLHLKISNVILADERQFGELTCKLAKHGGAVAIELRQSDKSLKEAIKYWPSVMKDAYGHFILLSPSMEKNSSLNFANLISSLCTSDRQLIFGLVNILFDHFVSSSVRGLGALSIEDATLWRSAATELAKQCQEMDSFISMEDVELKEEMVTESYSHLWLKFYSLQYRKAIFSNYEFKFAVIEESKSQRILLEFRDLESARPPFGAWPPRNCDQFGPKLLVNITPSSNSIKISLSDKLGSEDKDMLTALIKKLPSVVGQLSAGGYTSKRGWASWEKAVNELRDKPIVFKSRQRNLVHRARTRIIR